MHLRTEAHGANWLDHPMFDLHPSFVEVQAAKAVFKRHLSCFADDVNRGTMRPETAVSCALAEVWRHGKRFQRDQDYDALMELAGIAREAQA